MQLRFATGLTSEEYVNRQAWRDATLARCPLHPNGGCSFARHGTYPRCKPPGARIPRWYCPEGHRTFSLLPDSFAARLPDTLCEVEAVVAEVERAKSLEAGADVLRPDIELPGAIRWTQRRARAVHAALSAVRGLDPERFGACPPRVTHFQQHLGLTCALPRLRALVEPYLARLPAPLGFAPRPAPSGEHPKPRQHTTGPDPPVQLR